MPVRSPDFWRKRHSSATPTTVEGALKSAATMTANKSKDGDTITPLYVGGF
jgi:hypothetical protein